MFTKSFLNSFTQFLQIYQNVPIKLVMLNETLMFAFYDIIYNLFVIGGYNGIFEIS